MANLPEIICRVRAIYPFQSNERASLSFNPGDEIDVLTQLESGWWDGWCNGMRGWFPCNYVQIIQESTMDQFNDIALSPDEDIDHSFQRQQELQRPTRQRQQYSISSSNSSSTNNSSRQTPPPPQQQPKSDTSLDSHLPEGWNLLVADDGKTSYYYNHLTGGMRFKHPGLSDSDGDYDKRKIMTADALKRLSMGSSDDEEAITRQFQQQHYPYQSKSQDATEYEHDDDDDDDENNVEKMMKSWVQRETPQGRPYFCNLITQETTWNYEDIDPTTGHLRTTQDDTSSQDTDQHGPETPTTQGNSSGDGLGNDKIGSDDQTPLEPEITWSTLSSDIALAIHQLNTVAQQGQRQKLMGNTSIVVETIRVMLYASGSMEKDVSQTQDPALREPRRAVMASLSKLVLSAKMAAEATSNDSPTPSSSASSETVIKVQRDAGDVLSAVRNFVTTCQQCQVQVAHVDPRLIDTPEHIFGHIAGNTMNNKTMLAAVKKLQDDPSHHHPVITTSTSSGSPSATPASTSVGTTMKLSDAGLTMVQKAKYPLNQDLVVSLRTHANQIYGSTDALSTSVSFLLTLHRADGDKSKTGKNDYNDDDDNNDDNDDEEDSGNDGRDTFVRQKQRKHSQRPAQYHHYEDSAEEENVKANVVHLFRSLSSHLSQFLSILEDIDVPAIVDVDNELPSLRSYRADKQMLFNGVGQLFGTVQQLTDQMNERTQAVHSIDQAIARVERAMEGILTDVGEMVIQRHAWMVRQEEAGQNNNGSNNNPSGNNTNPMVIPTDGLISVSGDMSLSPITSNFYDTTDEQEDEVAPTVSLSGGLDDPRRRGTMASIRKRNKPATDDKSCVNWFLAPDYKPNELLFNNDNNVKGGTLAALVERLTMHDSFDTSYIATFLLTYRSFCATEEFVNLLQDRYNMQAPDDLTPDQLEIWTETKQKLVRLRVFNVLKNWLENYYDEEDEFILGRLEFFTNTVIRDASPFSADQLNRLIRKRKEADSNQSGLKKLVPKVSTGPLPIMPKNISHIRLLETDPLEMARQLSVLDFKLYSGIRPIECLNKAWSRDTVKGGVPVAVNVIQSIDYCNRLTSWVTDSILSYDEAKKRVVIIKYWAQVAEKCRNMNNYNTCMAIISAFDNSAIGRLKKTWELLGNRTSQVLSQIRKLMGANRNFTEYREMIHSVNPPCIPFLGIYLQDLTFIEDGNPDYLKKAEGLINFAKRQKCAEVIQEIKQFQSPPYTFHVVPELQDFIKSHLETSRDVETLYERSLHLEPRETNVAPLS
ncbi:ras guanine nucleotide exchange factor domain-containing protein [Halteromyces radiatus]|uniref:ras guanine nucleotide exchange factor domain-containing protein n=1 Tax=Halteromyces radiatus TaxID=101107 RepID=UPI0022208118|nr:ras guanine nucleotide exchange factor domain-containing protein [Halteromyces radiatus]KAI8089435.1 ras guanine nucleotide exchange factor domain-containing protein [Halteromyces radiatus]